MAPINPDRPRYFGPGGPEDDGLLNPGDRPRSVASVPGPALRDTWADYFQQQFGNYTPLPSPQTQQQEEARRLQQQTIQDLQTVAAGSMGTRAQRELAAQNKMGQQSQYALTSGQRGGDMRNAQRGAAQVASQLPGQANVLKLQEQQAAQAMLAQLLGQQQGQDIMQAQDQSQYELRGRALEDAHNQFMAGQGAQRELDLTDLAHRRALTELGYDLEANEVARDLFNKGMKAAASTAGTLSEFEWDNKDSGDSEYRQVDGKNSIVPKDDK